MEPTHRFTKADFKGGISRPFKAEKQPPVSKVGKEVIQHPVPERKKTVAAKPLSDGGKVEEVGVEVFHAEKAGKGKGLLKRIFKEIEQAISDLFESSVRGYVAVRSRSLEAI
jgi:hypothetical protein